MKKLLFVVALCIANLSAINAQYNDTPTQSTAPEGSDYTFSYSSELEIYGVNIGGDIQKYGYFDLGMAVGDDCYSAIFGIGVRKRYVSDSFMLLGRIYPYIGYSSVSYKELTGYSKYGNPQYETVDDDKVTYGMAGSITAGIKAWTTKSGKNAFITVGYYVGANEFETEDMFKNGSWQFGFSIVGL